MITLPATFTAQQQIPTDEHNGAAICEDNRSLEFLSDGHLTCGGGGIIREVPRSVSTPFKEQ